MRACDLTEAIDLMSRLDRALRAVGELPLFRRVDGSPNYGASFVFPRRCTLTEAVRCVEWLVEQGSVAHGNVEKVIEELTWQFMTPAQRRRWCRRLVRNAVNSHSRSTGAGRTSSLRT